MKPDLLVVNELPAEFLDALREVSTPHLLSQAEDRNAFLADVASRVRGVVTSGSFGLDRTTIDALPCLEIIGPWRSFWPMDRACPCWTVVS